NKMHLFYQKIRPIDCKLPHFLIKYALFSYYSKSHLNYAKVSLKVGLMFLPFKFLILKHKNFGSLCTTSDFG
ncbi:MAG: hypothetical protein DRQ51_06770, partial [Gammaproteobacteria bacterium]